ncbi:rRNA methyltransferase 3, mitochondrial [Lethenteron reissneri]|uniref:rRNA methyltransferase 3, mitochondrial n=1 Tax=Lethenteron reissneri TaxID=7753 RepID=UPI002AB62905|nr:rRNA methyltransferase 3, mitochondrial [Lethenteron reissneri]XP_061418119.1 rRNA methyltransferase 3, mitochondrial [Lethenteron reissneri]XP_061418120.1 rRNA methyltransferase 3, mitochondrial [Lethenteron reissneri]XP_061418121.1 rRNA methyltransferase 3, mitochondrial [Lethenteron reissneri]XP_061418122.1 rRNA methyltransferase 3, mitochondrial [Lethenteron reissneri]XP_061418124.1 rRNA methyltransferase 3, mitochondrial [Lethenteron reissneri]
MVMMMTAVTTPALASYWRWLSVRTARGWRRRPRESATAEASDSPLGRPQDATPPEQLGPRGAARGQDTWRRDERGAVLSVGDLRFERAGPDDKRLRTVVTIAKSRQYREKHGKILLEGTRLIRDALEAGAVLQTIFFDSTTQLQELPLELIARAALIRVRMRDIRLWSDLVTPQGILAIFRRPDYASDKELRSRAEGSECLPISLVCDNVRDPGNMGTIIRSAAAVGCSKVLLIKGCVDVWEPKVLRAGAGAHFRVPLLPGLRWKDVPEILGVHAVVHVADNRHTLSALDDDDVHDMSGDEGYEDDEDDEDDEREKEMLLRKLSSMPAHAYTLPWAGSGPGGEDGACETALVVSGEAQGLGFEALRLAEGTGGRRLHVGMAAGVESLNVAVAASVLLFEARRQLTMRRRETAAQGGAGSQARRTRR